MYGLDMFSYGWNIFPLARLCLHPTTTNPPAIYMSLFLSKWHGCVVVCAVLCMAYYAIGIGKKERKSWQNLEQNMWMWTGIFVFGAMQLSNIRVLFGALRSTSAYGTQPVDHHPNLCQLAQHPLPACLPHPCPRSPPPPISILFVLFPSASIRVGQPKKKKKYHAKPMFLSRVFTRRDWVAQMAYKIVDSEKFLRNMKINQN